MTTRNLNRPLFAVAPVAMRACAWSDRVLLAIFQP